MVEKSNQQVLARKPYKAPSLTVFGDVREITQAVGNMNTADGGSGSTSKTSA